MTEATDSIVTVNPLQLTHQAQGPAILMAPWPSHTSIMHGEIDNKLVFRGDGTSGPGDIITIKPANGMAQYRIASDDGETMVLELTHGSAYEPAAEAETAQPASENPVADGEGTPQVTETAAPAAPPGMETIIRRTIVAEACALRPEWAKTKGLPPAEGSDFDPDSIALADLPDDVLPELTDLFSDPQDLDLYTVVKGEIDARAAAIKPANDDQPRTVCARGKIIG